MRTFKLLFPVIVNLLFSIILFPVMDNELIYLIDRPRMSIEVSQFRLAFFLVLYYVLLFLLTGYWHVRNGKKYLSPDVNIRYLVCGLGITGIADVAGVILYYLCYCNAIEYL